VSAVGESIRGLSGSSDAIPAAAASHDRHASTSRSCRVSPRRCALRTPGSRPWISRAIVSRIRASEFFTMQSSVPSSQVKVKPLFSSPAVAPKTAIVESDAAA
jgi:hypothetical protein